MQSSEKKLRLSKLSSDQILNGLRNFSKGMINNLAEDQFIPVIPRITPSMINPVLFNDLFKNDRYRVNLLSGDQVLEFLLYFDTHTLGLLSDSQIQSLDLSKVIRMNLLNHLFDDFFDSYNCKTRVRQLSHQQIRENYQNFTPSMLGYMTNSQVDFLIPHLKTLNAKQFKALFKTFYSSTNRSRIQLLTVFQVQAFLEHFDSLSDLTDRQLKGLNLSGLPENLKLNVEKERRKRSGEPTPGSSSSSNGHHTGGSHSTGGGFHSMPFPERDPFSAIGPMEELSIPSTAGELYTIYTHFRNGQLKTVLNLKNKFTERELSTAYRQLARKLHSDKNQQFAKFADKVSGYLNNARDELNKFALTS